MDSLKRNWFWFAMGTLVVGCLAFYGLGVWSIRAENDGLRTSLEETQARLTGWQSAWEKDPARIPGTPQIQAYQAHADALRTLLTDSQEELKAPQRWRAAEAEDKWRVERLEGYSKSPVEATGRYNDRVRDLLQPDDTKPSGYAHMNFLAAGRDSFQFAQLNASSLPNDILREGKLLMIQLELVRILNESKVLRLPKGGISFSAATGTDRPDGRKSSQLSLRDPLKDDPLRATHPFGLQVDIDLRELPTLLDQMSRSSFNLNVTGLQIERLDPNASGDRDKRQELVDKLLVPGARRNEIIHLGLACEAVEFLFEEGKKGGKAP